ncbi:MAG: hypothetical protein JSW39_11625, partial [Desulfobacterales bacterium]
MPAREICYTGRTNTRKDLSDMPKRTILVASLVIVMALLGNTPAHAFKVVDRQFLWLSANFAEIPDPTNPDVAESSNRARLPLGHLAHDRYLEQHGSAPPLNFLQALQRGARSVARLSENDIVFHQAGQKKPLKTDIVPAGAERAAPYLLGVPISDFVLVVYPYYFYGCKENDYMVEVYSRYGSHLYTFDSLPTHVLRDNPRILIAPQKSGCCDSLRWSIRFYNLDTGFVSDFTCPEGLCGDLLFTQLDQEGVFIVGQEIIGLV